MKMHELLAKPENWTQGAPARNPSGDAVAGSNPEACQWCLFGAVNKCYPGLDQAYGDTVNKLYAGVAKRGYEQGYINWNDESDRTHEDVLSLCKELDI